MNPVLDTLAVWSLIGGALLFFIVRYWRSKKSGKACGGGCCPVQKLGVPKVLGAPGTHAGGR